MCVLHGYMKECTKVCHIMLADQQTLLTPMPKTVGLLPSTNQASLLANKLILAMLLCQYHLPISLKVNNNLNNKVLLVCKKR